MLHSRVCFEVLSDHERVLSVSVHAHVQCLRAAQHEEAVHRTGRATDRVLKVRELFAQRGVAADRAADDVGVSADVLGRGVNDQIDAQREGLLEVRHRERVVAHAEHVVFLADLGHRREIGQPQQGVRW